MNIQTKGAKLYQYIVLPDLVVGVDGIDLAIRDHWIFLFVHSVPAVVLVFAYTAPLLSEQLLRASRLKCQEKDRLKVIANIDIKALLLLHTVAGHTAADKRLVAGVHIIDVGKK